VPRVLGIRIGDDVQMTGTDSGSRPLLFARAVRVPFTADSVASPRLVYGGLDLASDTGRDDSYTAIYFAVAGGGPLGRVTFEGLDAVRAARGEMLPYATITPRAAADWVFTVDASPWLAERHQYELQCYSTPLLETHQHYTFQFHDEFAEAIAEGIWLDLADPAQPYARPAQHPLAELDPGLPAERFRSASGIDWELRCAPRPEAHLVHDSGLCSQRLYQLNLVLDGRSRQGASIWLRTRNGHTISRLIRPWPAGELARRDGIARPGDFTEPWEAYLAGVAERRQKMGR
jgi:hypothetical protein